MTYQTDEEILESFVGEVVTHIDVDEKENEILLTTESGRQLLIHHVQDCCESVRIEGFDGDFKSILGEKIIDLSCDEVYGEEDYGTSTKTSIIFKTDHSTVVNRWMGASDGYYSEGVNFSEIKRKENE